MTKMDALRVRIKALKGKVFTSKDVKGYEGDRNSHVCIFALVKNGEVAVVGRTLSNGQKAYTYREIKLRQIGLPTRTPFPAPLPAEDSPWEGTWLELPVPAAYLAGKKVVHYGLSRVDPDDE